MSEEDKPFKNREDVKKDIRLCSLVGSIVIYCSLGFALLGVIGDAMNIKLGLQTMSWFLLAIVFVLVAHSREISRQAKA